MLIIQENKGADGGRNADISALHHLQGFAGEHFDKMDVHHIADGNDNNCGGKDV